MQDTFWTPELWCEFINQLPLSGELLQSEMARFKSSKAPKKEWEIVAYSFEPLKGIDKPVLVTQGSKYWESAISGDKDFLIHSVRRLLDASEWHVKETVEVWDTGRFMIESFEISAGQMLVKTDGGTFLLNALIKLPQPILTTVDGVEIFDLDNFRPTVLFDDGSMNPNADERLWRNGVEKYNGKLFSSKEAAEKYLLNMISDKPLLSLNDVKEVCNVPGMRVSAQTDILIEKLTALVKQKLNQ